MPRSVESLVDELGVRAQRDVDGFVESTGTLELGGDRLLYVTFIPHDVRSTFGLTVSHSLFEFSVLQEAEIELCRAAARSGFAAIYVQAPGMGDSEGMGPEWTVDERVEGVAAAFDHLQRLCASVARPCFFGGRFGGLVATRAAQGEPGAALVLWDPSFDFTAYFKQVRRLVRMASVSNRQRYFKDPEAELAADGRSSVFGVEVTSELIDHLRAQTVPRGRLTGPVFAVAIDAAGLRSIEQDIASITDGPFETTRVAIRDRWHLGLRHGETVVAPTIAWMEEALI